MPTRIILDSKSAPGPSTPFTIADPARAATVWMRRDAAPGTLQAGDTATIQIRSPDGLWTNLVQGGADLVLDETTNHRSIYAKGNFRLDLTGAGAAISIYLEAE